MNKTEHMPRKRVHVAVGVIYNADGKILVAQRAASQHLGGLWEFPGGKVETGESVNTALTRELQEELGIVAHTQTPLCKISHDYSDKSVYLDVWNVKSFDGEAHGREGQPLRWLAPQELRYEDFPEANRAIIRAIQLPDYLAVLSADSDSADFKTTCSLLPDSCLIRLRQTNWHKKYPAQNTLVQQLEAGALHPNCRLVIDLADAGDHRWQTTSGIHGVHANHHVLNQLTQRPVPEHLLFGASCHNAAELTKAAACGADYVLLSPVLPTDSHPDQKGMGWEKFEQLARSVDIAVYAMGGMQKTYLEKARACGARGIAGIRLFAHSASV
jgi:8-oxo-dGTP diphosphatase